MHYYGDNLWQQACEQRLSTKIFTGKWWLKSDIRGTTATLSHVVLVLDKLEIIELIIIVQKFEVLQNHTLQKFPSD